jgi:hypothetical protein
MEDLEVRRARGGMSWWHGVVFSYY